MFSSKSFRVYGLTFRSLIHVEFIFVYGVLCLLAPLVAQKVKGLPAIWETQVQFLGQEDALEKGMVTNSSILAWRIP